MIARLVSVGAVVVLWVSSAGAHGLWGHVHVTGWAIENLPAGELRDFFADPEVMNAALFGAAFTDSGYAPQSGSDISGPARAYGEHTHWEPFVSAYIAWLVENDPPPWDDVESRKRAAFLMGCAAHGLQDEIFDSVFLRQVEHHDQGSQDNADPASDGFLALDEHLRFVPTEYLPMDTLLELYAPLNKGVTEDVIREAVGLVTSFYINDVTGPFIALELGKEHEPALPWTRAHYLDPEIPGSLRAEINPTVHYLEAVWERLHGRFDADQAVVHTFPEAPRRLLGLDAGTPDPWVTLIYGVGVVEASVETTWTSAAGEAVAYDQVTTRWGGELTRLHILQPKGSLSSGAHYRVTVKPGFETVEGQTSTVPFELAFQAPCVPADDAVCPDLGDIAAPAIDGSWVPPEPEPDPAPDSEPIAAEQDADPELTTVEPDIVAPPAASSGCQAARPTGASTPLALLLLVLLLLALGCNGAVRTVEDQTTEAGLLGHAVHGETRRCETPHSSSAAID